MWLTPDWPAPLGVHAVCTTRAGGVSGAPYDSLNLGDHVGDDAAHVAANRVIYAQAIGAQPIFLNQVHGTQVLQLDFQTPQGSEADACLTNQPGLACTIMVADCLPVLLTNTKGQWVAAAHAGWRGLAGPDGCGVLEQVCESIRGLGQVEQSQAASERIAWLGPCIGPKTFEVGDDVRHAFTAHDPDAAAMFESQGKGKWLANLSGLARQRLQKLGINAIYGNDGSDLWCTFRQPSRFFSHRRDRISGRLAVSIWRDA
jgi:YfiH family protein